MRAEIHVIDADDQIVAHHAHLIAVDEADHALMKVWLDGEGDYAATLHDTLARDVADVVGLALLVDGRSRWVEAFACGAVGWVKPLELLGEVANEGPGEGVACGIFHDSASCSKLLSRQYLRY